MTATASSTQPGGAAIGALHETRCGTFALEMGLDLWQTTVDAQVSAGAVAATLGSPEARPAILATRRHRAMGAWSHV